MERFIKGEIVVIPFPFSDLSANKKRLALVITPLPGDDLIVCQITSQHSNDKFAQPLLDNDFESGALHHSSYVRPNRIFTIDTHLVLYRIGKIRTQKFQFIADILIQIIKGKI